MFTKTFSADGAFGALYAAEDWLRENGFSYGSSQRGAPIGIIKGSDWLISKWGNMTTKEQSELHGQIQFRRDGDAVISIKDEFAAGLRE